MLLESLLAALSPVPASLRRLGHAGFSARLWSRARRCRGAWAPHEARCRAVVERAMADLPRRRTALVLGSGLVRDVPVALLSAAFERVVLVDAVHLPPVRWRMRAHRNVALLTRDLSGVADWLAGGPAERRAPLADLAADERVDLVVSANLLSQLPLAPERHLERRPGAAPADLPDRLIGWHLADLAAFRARVCLLTDVSLREIDRGGAVHETLDLLRGHVLPPPDEAWDWTVAPFGEASRRTRLVHRVQAYADLARAGR